MTWAGADATSFQPVTSATPSAAPRRILSPYLALITLVVLLVPLGIGMYFFGKWYRHYRCQRVARELRLNGERRPGEVDDAQMGQAMGQGEWLRGTGPAAENGLAGKTLDGGGSPTGQLVSTKALSEPKEFDPIGQQAAVQRAKQITRREAARGFNATIRADNDNGSSVDYSSVMDGDGGDEDGAMQQLYATSIMQAASMQRWGVGTHDSVLGSTLMGKQMSELRVGGGTSEDASSPLGRFPTMAGGTEAVVPTYHDPEYFNQTARVLLGCYPGADGVDAASQNASPTLRRGSELFNNDANTPVLSPSGSKLPVGKFASSVGQTFENILSSLAAPLQLGKEYHQKGDAVGLSQPVSTAPAAETSASDEAGDHDEPVFAEDEETDDEESETSVAHN